MVSSWTFFVEFLSLLLGLSFFGEGLLFRTSLVSFFSQGPGLPTAGEASRSVQIALHGVFPRSVWARTGDPWHLARVVGVHEDGSYTVAWQRYRGSLNK